MVEVTTFPFDKKDFNKLKEYHFGLNWPVVYIQEDGKEMYIGQTTNLYSRSQQHYENPKRAKLKRIHVITDEDFNLSAAFDLESQLIQYVAGDGRYKLQNGNGGLINHDYYEKEAYTAKLKTIWPLLQKKGFITQELETIKNSDFFKFSPYKALREDQVHVANVIVRSLKQDKPVTHIVNGAPGTGKTILALYLLKHLRELEKMEGKSIALVVPMAGLRATLKKVVRRIPSLGADSVIGPSDLAKKKYDIVIVDEAHRLSRRVNITNYPGYDAVNKKLGLPKEATQLDWVMRASTKQVLLYDAKQTVIPRDVRAADFAKLKATHHELVSQMRVEGGSDYLAFVDDLLSLKKPTDFDRTKYDFKIFSDIQEMVDAIKKKNTEHSLARLVAGYAWSWRTHRGAAKYDIEIDGVGLTWNSVTSDWVNSKNAINEVGCIHTIQGYDLNYTGVIIGPELSYDEKTNKIVVDETKYLDFNGRRSITEPEELQNYIINIYKTLLTRGILGTYIYVNDPALRRKFKELTNHQTIS